MLASKKLPLLDYVTIAHHSGTEKRLLRQPLLQFWTLEEMHTSAWMTGSTRWVFRSRHSFKVYCRVSIVGTMEQSRITTIGDKFQSAIQYVSAIPTTRTARKYKIVSLYVLGQPQQPCAQIITGLMSLVLTQLTKTIWTLYVKDGPFVEDMSYLLKPSILVNLSHK